MTAARNSQPCSAGTYVMSPHQRVSTAAASGVKSPRNLSNLVRRQATRALCGEVSGSEAVGGWLIHTLVGSGGG